LGRLPSGHRNWTINKEFLKTLVVESFDYGSDKTPLSPIMTSFEAIEISNQRMVTSDAHENDGKSEGSLCLEDLLDDGSSDGNSSIENSCDGGQCQHHHGDDMANEEESLEVESGMSKSSQRSQSALRQYQRRKEKKQQDWENLSSSTVYTTGYESCVFDMSSRSLLEDCDFEMDFSMGGETTRTPAVRFSAGNLRSNKSEATFGPQGKTNSSATPMSRITEHTRESSARGSQSDMSDRHSFASGTSPSVFGSYHRRLEARMHRASFEFSPSPTTEATCPLQRCDILNIQDLKSLRLSGD
jgi:hypothetical protein